MELYEEETDFNITHIPMFQKVVDMFEGRSGFQRIVRLGLLANMDFSDELDVTSEDDYEYDRWVRGRNNSHGYPRFSDRSTDTRSSSSVNQLPLHYYTSAYDPHPSSVKAQGKEKDTEKKATLLQETKKSKERAEKKCSKKQKKKLKKRREKLEKEKQKAAKSEEEKDDAQQSKSEESKSDHDKSSSSVTELASAKDTDSSDSSEDESCDEDSDAKNDSGDSEELDMTSTFVSKAALIARRKLEKKPRPEKEKKKIPVKEEPKTVPDKHNEDLEVEKKDSAALSSPTLEDNVKISTDLANIGNRHASDGNFNMAVKYFTDAIKYNPTEYKLFGNRSFCFEKMQEYVKALTDAELSLSMCPGWVKGLFRKGRALAGLKRYEEAAQAFRDVLKLDSSCAEAAQELMRVQIIQLMAYGFTREQSTNALIIHGTVETAVEVLSKLNHRPGGIQNEMLPPPQVANISGVSPVLSANINVAPLQTQDASKLPLRNKPLGPVQNMSYVKTPKTTNGNSHPTPGLFPVWVGNLIYPVTETVIKNLFNKVGVVYSVKVLTYKRCAFVNFTKQEHCEEAIQRFNGYELNGVRIAVRYPDRIPQGMGISKTALKANDLQDDDAGTSAAGGRRPARPYRHVPDSRANHKY
uniref:tetratricopeptide repeat protein 31-like isoform X2 n=1 Tax=Scatophagus argus TaxID=75038 RepID=UPI001ED7F8B1|nr:tetratricopeptide repeat protein 31-like isoform X2 [Scatophagus argus]